jgi:hypothetical protein
LGKADRFVDTELGELRGSGDGVPVVARQRVVVAHERWETLALASPALADRVGLTGRLDVGDGEHPIPPDDAHVSERVVDEAYRLVA